MSEFTPEQIAAAAAAEVEQKEAAAKEMEAINDRLLAVLDKHPGGVTPGESVGITVTVDGEDLSNLLGLAAYLLQGIKDESDNDPSLRPFIAAAALALGRVTVVHAEALVNAE